VKKEIVPAKETGGDITTFADEFEKDAQLGGKLGAADLALPFVKVLQGLSSQLKRDKPDFIKGAAIGDICLTVLNRLWPGDEGVDIIFCHYSRVFCEWKPDFGGLAGVYAPEDPIVLSTPAGEKGRRFLPNGNELIETAYHAILIDVDGNWMRAVMPLKSTMLKISKRMNNILSAFELPNKAGELVPAPRWSRIFRMTTGTATGGGNDWAVPKFDVLDGHVDRSTYVVAKAWAVAADKQTNFAASEAAQGGGGKVVDEVPF